MKKLIKNVMLVSLLFGAMAAHGKLNNIQIMKCIDSDKLTKSAFSDLQAAYEMRLVSAKDFFKVMDKPSNCPQLRKDLKKLQASAIAQMPQSKVSMGRSSGSGSPSSNGAANLPRFDVNTNMDFNSPGMNFPAPPPMPESDFADFEDDEDFGDF